MRDDRRMEGGQGSSLWRRAMAVLAWGSLVFLLFAYGDERSQGDADGPLVLGVAFFAMQGLGVALRNRRPGWAVLSVLAGSAGMLLIAADIVVPITGYLVLGSFASAHRPPASIPALVGLIGVCALTAGAVPAGDTGFAIAVAVGAWALGEVARNRREAIAESSRRAVTEEQARIARELHDVIAHSVSVIVVQAGAARDVFDSHPERARAALTAIEGSGREAMAELRHLLGRVRPGEEPSTVPQPGLGRLDDLVEPFRAAGLEVVVERDGDTQALPPGVDLNAYRLVQEALTNALRHADASRVDVCVRSSAGEVDVEVTDDGRGAAVGAGGKGHGLVGMRERVALLGGVFEAGPGPGGGFRVHARIPLETG